MKKFIFTLVILLVAGVTAGAQTTTVSDKTVRNGASYSSITSTRSGATQDFKTEYTWNSTKENVEHIIYLHQYTKGDKVGKWTAYVIRTSKKTGKEYKYYLPDGEAIAQDIIKRNPNIIK